MEKKIHTKVQNIFHIKDIKQAVKAASKFNRQGKILVKTSDIAT